MSVDTLGLTGLSVTVLVWWSLDPSQPAWQPSFQPLLGSTKEKVLPPVLHHWIFHHYHCHHTHGPLGTGVPETCPCHSCDASHKQTSSELPTRPSSLWLRQPQWLTGLSVTGPSPLCWARSKLGPYWLPPTWSSSYHVTFVKIIWSYCEEDHTRKYWFTQPLAPISQTLHTHYTRISPKMGFRPKNRFKKSSRDSILELTDVKKLQSFHKLGLLSNITVMKSAIIWLSLLSFTLKEITREIIRGSTKQTQKFNFRQKNRLFKAKTGLSRQKSGNLGETKRGSTNQA